MRKYNEDALVTLNEIDSRVCEIFLESFCEYNEDFGKLLKSRQGSLTVNSVHTLNTHFEPELFSINPRAKDDAFKILGGVMKAAEQVNAKYYTFHGKSRIKKDVNYDNYPVLAKGFDEIIGECLKSNVIFSLENVVWAMYNRVGYFSEIRKLCPKLKGVLDIKQARISGEKWQDYLTEMGNDLVTVHVSDIDDNGKIRLPGKGNFDFTELFRRLKDVGFDGNILIEVYKDDFGEISELKDSLDFLRNLKNKVI